VNDEIEEPTMEIFRDRAFTFAKQRGDTQVDVPHLLYVVFVHYRNVAEQQGLRMEQVQATLPVAGASRKPPQGYTAAFDAAMAHVSSQTAALTWMQQVIGASDTSTHTDDTPPANRVEPSAPTTAATATHATTKRSLTEIYADLDGLVGLELVKQLVKQIVARQKAQVTMQERGKDLVFSKHLVFTGAPGTGKTTVARLVGELYAAIDVLPSTTFVEATRADLIGGYVGQTAIKVVDVVEKARGGVLFIDEAYALMPRHESDFAHEALSTLVQKMEDLRDELVVIMAGYRDEMQQMIDANPGLRSRMTTIIDFPNYTPVELHAIFGAIVARYGLTVTDDAHAFVLTHLTHAVQQTSFGNARHVRSLWELAFTNLAMREHADGQFSDTELHIITKADVEAAVSQLQHGRTQAPRGIGFVPNRGNPKE
jgi:SpoVK/Ycf46/Vps4 family AAA+-type ATPase